MREFVRDRPVFLRVRPQRGDEVGTDQREVDLLLCLVIGDEHCA
jgi:hypothetical protein